MDLSIILQAANERPFLEALFPRLAAVLQQNRVRFELILVDGGSSDGTREWAAKSGATVVTPKFPGYGGGLLAGFAAASGEYCLTLDADMSHEPEFVAKLWRARDRADIVVASRYVRGGVSHTSLP